MRTVSLIVGWQTCYHYDGTYEALPMASEWYFDELDQKVARQGDIPTKHAFDTDVDTFVREVLQNANDAGPVDESEPVRVIFRFRHLTPGNGLEEFRSAFDWDQSFDGHLEAASEEEQDGSIEKFLEDESQELVLLTIEDHNTVGLAGAEDANESNYTALVRDMHRSNKAQNQGGSHGVGGTVLWAFSGISTVLFTSNPEDSEGGDSPRFVGRSYLPDHTIDDNLFKGYGWLGQQDPSGAGGRHVSLWGEDAARVASDLSADRPNEPGTSLTIVGFREPGRSQPTGEAAHEMAEEIKQAAVENFWPAISRKQLEVCVQDPSDDDPRPANFETVGSVRPFLEAYTDLYKREDEFGESGGTSSRVIKFDFPGRKDDTETPIEGQVSLSVRTAAPAEEALRNQVAVFRGAGMVVQYVSMDDAARYGPDFHAVLACGRARTELGEDHTELDESVEALLRAAEPAAHNEWTGTPRLKNTYKRGCVKTVTNLQSTRLRDSLRELVADEQGEDGDRIRSMEKFFPGTSGIGDGGGPSPTPGSPGISAVAREIHELSFGDGRWEAEMTLEREDGQEEWGARVWLNQMMEGGRDGDRLPISTVHVLDGDGAVDYERESDGAILVHRTGPEPIRLRCASISTGPPDPTSGRIARTGVRHEAEDEWSK